MKKLDDSPYFRSTLMVNVGIPAAVPFSRGRRTRTSPSDSCRMRPAVDVMEAFALSGCWLSASAGESATNIAVQTTAKKVECCQLRCRRMVNSLADDLAIGMRIGVIRRPSTLTCPSHSPSILIENLDEPGGLVSLDYFPAPEGAEILHGFSVGQESRNLLLDRQESWYPHDATGLCAALRYSDRCPIQRLSNYPYGHVWESLLFQLGL